MASNLIQLVGIPGSGKSYLLREYFSQYKPQDVKPFEFGQRLRELREKDLNQHPIDFYIVSLINELISAQENYVISSHLVHRENDNYVWDFKYDRMADAVAYVHIITPPRQLHRQRSSDNTSKRKIRSIDIMEVLEEHQKISLEKTAEIAKELSSDLLVIYNTPKRFQKNLELLDQYFHHYF